MKQQISYILLASSLILCGCASSPIDVKGTPVLEPSKLTGAPIQPYAETYPISAMPQPAVKSVPTNEEPLPVWENPQIQKVAVDAFVDENGNLHPKSYMYVVTKKGGWNLDAVRKPSSYIPPENAVMPINGYGTYYGPSYTVAENEKVTPASLLLTDTANLKLTGIIDPNAGELARSQIDPLHEVAVFDKFVGWVIAPKNTVAYNSNIQNVYREEVKKSAIAGANGQIQKPNMGIRSAPPVNLQPMQQPNPAAIASPEAFKFQQEQQSVNPQIQQTKKNSKSDELFGEF